MARYYSRDTSWLGIIIWLIIVVGSIYGYVMNIVKLVGMLDDPITGWFVARCVGVIAGPLGVVLGYLG
jgi:hypothetical protein